MGIPAFYFDGRSSRKHSVELSVQDDVATLSGDVEVQWPIADLRVSERLRHGARKVTFPDGAYLEVQDNASFNQLLADTGHQDSPVVRLQQSLRGSMTALLATLIILVLGYLYGLPALSKAIAFAIPERIEHSIGRESLNFFDRHMFEPSVLPIERRNAITQHFRLLTPPQNDVPNYEIVFRKSKIGPNAFALPSGQIVITDEIINLMDDDQAVMGILAHELGHLHQRHLMRRIIQVSAVGAIITVLVGDVSTLVANVPTVLLDMKYSRDAEREADDYAISLFKANGIKLSSLAYVFEKLGEKSDNSMPYMSTHPSSSERIARIRAAN
jgi:Zn-dependent protease with chaperone function